ncbi:MAG: TMEM43 family protein [Bacteroidaceae bacterium]|nr:TMEM43 family protein [Bacteroidaceae bacterium]
MKIWKVIIGTICIAAGVAMFVFGEINNNNANNLLKDAKANIIHIDNIDNVNPANEQKLVHINGLATTDEILSDNIFGIDVNALCFVRDVQYYQWVEKKDTWQEKDNKGNQKTVYDYSHKTVWVSEPVNSGEFHESFGHQNYCYMKIPNEKQRAKNVCVGAYHLNDRLLEGMDSLEAVNFHYDDQYANVIKEQIKRYFGEKVNVEVSTGKIFMGTGTSKRPHVGDMKITFTSTLPSEVSIIAKQSGNTFVPYYASGDSIFHISRGIKSQTQIIENIEKENNTALWCSRIIGIVLVVIGVLLFIFNKK